MEAFFVWQKPFCEATFLGAVSTVGLFRFSSFFEQSVFLACLLLEFLDCLLL